MTENEEDTSHSMLPPHPVVPERRRWYRNRAAPLVAVVGLLVALGMDPDRKGMAIAVNDAVIPRSTWQSAPLNEGDTVEIIHAVQGG